jgi:hypothetical protein
MLLASLSEKNSASSHNYVDCRENLNDRYDEQRDPRIYRQGSFPEQNLG